MWRGGCIIRSTFLGKIKEAFDNNPGLTNLLLDPFFRQKVVNAQESWRRVTATALLHGIPVPAFTTALCYFDGFRSERLPANLLQAQRDYFGAHTYERIDRPRRVLPYKLDRNGEAPLHPHTVDDNREGFLKEPLTVQKSCCYPEES